MKLTARPREIEPPEGLDPMLARFIAALAREAARRDHAAALAALESEAGDRPEEA